jgi:hypothetical protein
VFTNWGRADHLAPLGKESGLTKATYFKVLLTLATAAALACSLGLFTAVKFAHAQTTAPATLTGEFLGAFQPVRDNPTDEIEVTFDCRPNGSGEVSTVTYTAEGVAVGPYPGTFRETGKFELTELPADAPIGTADNRIVADFEAEFTIELDAAATFTRVTGTKSASDVPFGTGTGGDISQPVSSLQGYAFCDSVPNVVFNFANVFGADYFARIETDSGTFLDRGKTNVGVAVNQCCSTDPLQLDIAGFQEAFFSDLTEPESELPTTKAQCKDKGFEDFGFKNQGDCVAFVATGGKNEPGKNQKT